MFRINKVSILRMDYHDWTYLFLFNIFLVLSATLAVPTVLLLFCDCGGVMQKFSQIVVHKPCLGDVCMATTVTNNYNK